MTTAHALIGTGFIVLAAWPSLAVVHNQEDIPAPYESYAEILVEANVVLENGESFTGTVALYDRAIMLEAENYTEVAYVPITAGTVVEKVGKNATKVTTPDDRVYEGRASTRTGSIVLVCKRLGPAVDTRMVMNLQAKFNYLSGIDHVRRFEVLRVLEDRYLEARAGGSAGPEPEWSGPSGGEEPAEVAPSPSGP